MASIDDIVANKKCEGDCSICLKKLKPMKLLQIVDIIFIENV